MVHLSGPRVYLDQIRPARSFLQHKVKPKEPRYTEPGYDLAHSAYHLWIIQYADNCGVTSRVQSNHGFGLDTRDHLPAPAGDCTVCGRANDILLNAQHRSQPTQHS